MTLDEGSHKLVSLLRGRLGVAILVNGVSPWLVYTWAQPDLGRVHALMASAVPPIAWSMIQFVREKRIDALSMFVLAGIGLSLAAFFGGGSYRMLELREHLVTGVTGLVVLGSVAVKRPIVIAFGRAVAKEKSQAEAERFESRLERPPARRLLIGLTLGAGFFLLIETAIAISLVFTVSVREFLVVSPILHYALGGLALGALLYLRPKLRAAFGEAEGGSAMADPAGTGESAQRLTR
jgi:hypothetical protein